MAEKNPICYFKTSPQINHLAVMPLVCSSHASAFGTSSMSMQTQARIGLTATDRSILIDGAAAVADIGARYVSFVRM
jgi:hypothetical protein